MQFISSRLTEGHFFLFQISHRCLVNELQRFPVLRKRMDEVTGNFLREGLEPAETMIAHIIEMEVSENSCNSVCQMSICITCMTLR